MQDIISRAQRLLGYLEASVPESTSLISSYETTVTREVQHALGTLQNHKIKRSRSRHADDDADARVLCRVARLPCSVARHVTFSFFLSHEYYEIMPRSDRFSGNFNWDFVICVSSVMK